MTTTLAHPQGRVHVEDVEPTLRHVSVEMFDRQAYVLYPSFDTGYPVELIERILALRGPAQLGYSILREENPAHLKDRLGNFIFSYVAASELEGKRALDFGCGSGSSAVALGEMFPGARFVAVDLSDGNVAVARLRARYRGVSNVAFLVSPGPSDLPPDVGTFDVIFLTAVCEHLVPDDRTALLPELWRALRPGGLLFVSETPHRYYPLEYHTTGLPLLNYLPSQAALWATRRFSRREPADVTWEALLRGGVRGCTEGELVRILRSAGDGYPVVLRPRHRGHRDQVDIWYSESMARRPLRAKSAMRVIFKGVGRATRADFVPTLYLAIEKRAAAG